MKESIVKLSAIKIKKFCLSKGAKWMWKKAMVWEKKHAEHITNKWIYPEKNVFYNIHIVCIKHIYALAAAESLQSCLTLCDPIDGSPPGSPVPGILQARTLEWVAISFSNAWKWKVKAKSLSHVRLLATPWTMAHQAPLSMGFSRQECWSGVPLPSPICTW